MRRPRLVVAAGRNSAPLCRVAPEAYLLPATRAALASPGTITLPHAPLTS